MNIEELSKSQLLLLTILVNFVMSVATAILTVSLLDQAPPVVTQTINRVVQQTVETVAAATPVVTPKPAAPTPSDQDLTTAAFTALSSRTVTIYDGTEGTSSPAIAIGTYLPQSQVVATAALSALPAQALIVFSDGSFAPASLAKSGEGVAIYGFGDNATLPQLPAVSIIPPSSLELGQTVLALSSDGTAEEGIVAKVGKSVSTTLSGNSAGPAAVDLNGDLIGILSGAAPGDLLSASAITDLLTATSSLATSTPASP